MSLGPGVRLGAYEVTARLGAGAMGEVFRARDSRLGREVALKVLPAEFAASEDRRRRFEQESRAAGALNHPNIVAVYDVGEQDGVSYIVSELVDGESLRDVLERGPMPVRRAVEIGAQIAEGLAAAHSANVVHRDLKPENVMLTRDGRPKILDFGLARYQPATVAEGTMTMTQPGMVMGTAGYMSPEQVTGSPADARSDIFSLGIMLHEMLGGKLPFARATTIETMSAILRDDPIELPAAVPAPLCQVVLHCLEKEPARRFQSANDLAFNLRAAAPGSMAESRIAASPALPVAQKRPFRWARAAAVVLGIVAVAAIGGLLERGPGGADLASYRFTPLATDSNPAGGPAWSPDGKNVAYVQMVSDAPDRVMVRSLDSPVPVQVASINGPRSLFWSPDGSRVYFVNEEGIWSVSRGGGEKGLVLKGQYYAATMSPDGKALAAWLVVGDADKSEPKLWISSPPGATPRPYEPVVFKSQGSFTPVFLRFSPDGTQILLAATRGEGPQLWLLPYPDGTAAKFKPRRILTKALAGSDVPNINWMPDGRRFVMSLSQPARPQAQLWMADSRTEKLTQLTAGEYESSSPAVSPDGAKIAFDSVDSNLDIVQIPVAGGPIQPMLATSRNEMFPAWAPKGSTFAYVTDRSGRKELWLRNTVENTDRPLVTQKDFPDDETLWLMTPSISPDGSRIAYARVSNKHLGELWISPMSGGSPLRVGGGKSFQIAPQWSPDGKSLVYFDSDPGVVKVAVGSNEAPVSLGLSHGCENPAQWSPDGKWIACATEGHVELVSPDGKSRRTIGNRQPYITWSADGKQIYALGHVEGKTRFGAIDVKTGVEKTIYEYGPDVQFGTAFNPAFPMSLSPDGKSIATTIVRVRSDIWLLEGFGGQ